MKLDSLLFLTSVLLVSSAIGEDFYRKTKIKRHKERNHLNYTKPLLGPVCDGSNCLKSSKVRKNVQGTKVFPKSETSQVFYDGNETNLTALAKTVLRERKKCKSISHKGFRCQRLKWYVWLLGRLDRSSTPLNRWVELVRNPELSENVTDNTAELMPENFPEETIFRLLRKWGDPVDLFLFHKYKEFVKSRELRITVPNMFQVQVGPRTHSVSEVGRSTPRIFWDPGFNLKLKFPFFKDELKVAVSTGPAFLVGIGAGMILLIVKSMFAPFLLGMKWMMYNLFWKDGSPWDMMKMVWGGFGGGHHGPEPWESALPPPSIEHYEPPPVHNHLDNMRELPHSQRPHHFAGPTGPSGPGTGFGYGWGGGDQKNQFSQLNPILNHLATEGRRQQHFNSLLTAPEGGGGGSGGMEYIPSTALQAEVEHYDPFYSPLLSRIDSIFTHLGYHEEGCRERAVCSIYKFPVKYAPYSNLLSAQLSKHQSELKRPITKSPRILRYFKYMKAAKDGQGQASCLEMYPNCEQDTDSVTNLPMITTFNQLSELMGSEATGPSGS